MRIHKSDPAAIAGAAFKSWQEIVQEVERRAVERAELDFERTQWRRHQRDDAWA